MANFKKLNIPHTKKTFVDIIQGDLNCYHEKKWFKDMKVKKLKVFDKIEDFSNSFCQGYFGFKDSQPHTLFIIFMGSSEPEDWDFNFNFWKRRVTSKDLETPYSNVNPLIKVHRGITDYYLLVRDVILKKAKKYKKLVVSGHSLGGGATILASVDLKFNYPGKDLLSIPVSAPRIGNAKFRDSYNKRVPNTYRVWYGNDTVTHVPPFIAGFRHVGIAVHLGNHWWEFWKILTWVWDHYPQRVLEALKKEWKVKK